MTGSPVQSFKDISRQTTTFCQCWKLTRTNGEVRGYTDHDMPLMLADVKCSPLTGFNASEAKKSLGLSVDVVDIEGAISASDITIDDITKGLLDGAKVETFLVNWQHPQSAMHIGSAIIGKIKRMDGRFIAELESRMHSLDQPNGRYLTRHCDAELGDARCGFNLKKPGMKGVGKVLSFEGEGLMRVKGLEEFPSGWFSYGVLSWIGKPMEGKKAEITNHFKQNGKLYLDFTEEAGQEIIQAGSKFKITVGCNKNFTSCIEKFNNSLNFRGFPHLPGNDRAYIYGNGDQNFDGRPVVS